MNKIFLVGRVTQPPEQRTTSSGISVTTFNLAVNRRFNRDETDFFRVVTWRGLADNCARYLVKGQRVAVEGELQIRTYDANDGTKRTSVEVSADNVEFLDRPNGSGNAGSYQGGSQNYSAQNRPAAPTNEEDLFASEMGGVLMDEEELPF